ncbi:MAG: hypothetical protein Kow0098_25540 [Ignavibacteriaceae bacterium]
MKSGILLFIFCFSLTVVGQDIKQTTEQIIENVFGGDVNFSYEKYSIPPDVKSAIEIKSSQKFFGNEIYLFKIIKSGKLLSIGLMDNVYGKELPITFIVFYDSSGKIISSNIVKYREAYGGAVQNESWNKQFKGKNSESGFSVGKDISGISGATISVKSVTAGVKKLTLLFNIIREQVWK